MRSNVFDHPLRFASHLVLMKKKLTSPNAESPLAAQLSNAQKKADAAKKAAKAAKTHFREAKKNYKEARREAKIAKKLVKELKAAQSTPAKSSVRSAATRADGASIEAADGTTAPVTRIPPAA